MGFTAYEDVLLSTINVNYASCIHSVVLTEGSRGFTIGECDVTDICYAYMYP